MLILPPYQGMGIGAEFIESIYNKFKDDPKVVDITVEDPSDDFRRVRNFVDAKLCVDLPEFAADRLKEGFGKEMIQAAKSKYKINPRQCRIVYEILRLNATNVNNEDEYMGYRLCVKKRLNAPHQKQKEDLEKMKKRGVDVSATAATIPSTEERIEQLKEEYQVCWCAYKRHISYTIRSVLIKNMFYFQAHEEEYYRIINRLKSHN